MNPNQAPSAAITRLASSVVGNRRLIWQLAKREIVGRYRGSMVGLAWSFFNPLMMLVIYTFVFSVVFKARWGIGGEETKADFAIILFVGLIIHGMFAECVNRSPALILSNVSYVKKVVFPLEILPWVAVLSALFHTGVSTLVLLIVQLAINHHLPWTAILFPLVMFPLVLSTVGFSYALAAAGVYIRDIGQLTVMFTTVLFFVSPVVYPVAGLPEEFQGWMRLSPLTTVIEEGRKTLIYGQTPDPVAWLVAVATGLVLAWLGFALFQKMRRGFADVL
jgi:lipopolysaccharide transport system permease protein